MLSARMTRLCPLAVFGPFRRGYTLGIRHQERIK